MAAALQRTRDHSLRGHHGAQSGVSDERKPAEPAEVEKFVNARVEVGELMTSYFQGWERYGEGQRPSPERMEEMTVEINAKLEPLLAKYDLTVESYRERIKDVLADEVAVKGYLSQHPDVKKRYDALPFDRMRRAGGSGRGY